MKESFSFKTNERQKRKRYSVSLSSIEKDRLQYIAEERGLSMSVTIRELIAEEMIRKTAPKVFQALQKNIKRQRGQDEKES